MKKILLFSSLCKPKSVLELSLPSWLQQEAEGFTYDILVYNDNKEVDAEKFTEQFAGLHQKVSLLDSLFTDASTYKKHHWTQESVDRIIDIKNRALEISLEHDYDAIFMVDADLVLHPQTLKHLVELEKDFVFEIFWTVFTDQTFAKPNCWDVHSWDYYDAQSILKLKEKGTYQVGAGGACTLLSNKAVRAGVNFSKIKNMPFGGEDRHICTRAEVLGFPIFIDTHLPAFHIYNSDLVKEAQKWFLNGCDPHYFQNWLDDIWESSVIEYQKKSKVIVPNNKIQKIKIALYKAKRSYINYMRYH
ncbi:hypothetical protein [Nonlabens sp.]|uniref:hypothetical protein n=1 Tax=Nonlabens sp. TaxID=1888209 RepID=UPI0025F29D89|nr:hypothetical protein [Nonlabens sp.]